MKRFSVLVHARAWAEAVESYEYIRERSPANAERWIRGLNQAMDSLQWMPHRCPLARENERFPQELRHLIYHSHRIVFTIEDQAVRILYIRHSARGFVD